MLRGTVSALLLAGACLVLAVTGVYVGRPQTMIGETPLAGIVRPMPLGGPPPSYNTQCCPCMSANQIYPGGYNVINRNLISPPVMNHHMFQGSQWMSPSLQKQTLLEPEPTPETAGGSNGSGDR
ncbi:uncharacterized protein LOC144622399 [Crassostrea virginica]